MLLPAGKSADRERALTMRRCRGGLAARDMARGDSRELHPDRGVVTRDVFLENAERLLEVRQGRRRIEVEAQVRQRQVRETESEQALTGARRVREDRHGAADR